MHDATALIGYSGFVGTTLRRQTSFDSLYRSTNIESIRGGRFSMVVCAGAPAQKWIANREPEEDSRSIRRLISAIDGIEADCFILISTVDVFANPVSVSEDDEPDAAALHPYGRHRLQLERFVRDKFEKHLVVRLPGLVGPGLRKNVLYDLKNNNQVSKINADSIFQYYPMVNLWADIGVALRHNLSLVHLTSEPVHTGALAQDVFSINLPAPAQPGPRYDFRTMHAKLFGGQGNYQYSLKEELLAIRSYAQCGEA
ncbi:hypothetical protein [Thiohalobacter sp.]|uniref:hypothetical protein n=1 Tax=Thiohalobacter sp. TaxID=2025948 RepID=UPI00262BBB84|nr:hypothetical protein [Thiohalobacter sp.]